MILVLSRSDQEGLVTVKECAAAVEDAFARHDASGVGEPIRRTLASDPGLFHVTLGLVPSPGSLAAKVNGWFPPAPGEAPRPTGAILLADSATGQLQCLLDSRLATQLRTAPITALSIRRFAPASARRVAILGAGSQLPSQVEAVRLTLPSARLVVWSRSAEHAERSARQAGPDVQAEADLAHATSGADVIITLTPSREAFLSASHVDDGTLVIALGADAPDKNELAPDLVARATLITDITAQCAAAGELRSALAVGAVQRSHVQAELGAILSGRVPFQRATPSGVVVVDSTGTAIQDAAAGRLIFDEAQRRGVGQLIELHR